MRLMNGWTACLAAVAFAAAAAGQTGRVVSTAAEPGEGALRVRVEPVAWAALGREPVELRGFPLPDGSVVDLRLERFEVLSPRARVVVVSQGGEREVKFDRENLVFLRGGAPAVAGSHVFLSIIDGVAAGRIEMGPGRGTYALSGQVVAADGGLSMQVAAPTPGGSPALDAGCSLRPQPAVTPMPGVTDEPVLGMRQAEIAVDSDYPLYQLFNSPERTQAYLLQVIAQVSDIMMRDLRVRLDIVFLRVFTINTGPYFMNGGMPQLPPGTPCDLAHMISGTRDIGAGGGAFLCNRDSWIAFTQGYVGDPSASQVANQDVIISAHELGHNLGSLHTYELGVDRCDLPTTPTRRGSIISYCYYFSGGYANIDMQYHTVCRQEIIECLATRPQFVRDCNQNGIADPIDIATGFSMDANATGIPDECEDCNHNLVLDPQDIATGFSLDVNTNGIPDECEADCNGNAVPDEMDIRTGTSTDLQGNAIPDECEADLNGNNQSDDLEINANMALDIDRDAMLDSVQDCDGDTTPDLTELDGANNPWAISSQDGVIREYHFVTGVLMRSSAPGFLSDPQDLRITPDRRILVSSAADDRVVEFDKAGAYVRDLVASGAGGLDRPAGLLVVPGGTLLVASGATGSVLKYDLATGAPAGVLVASGAGGLTGPYALAPGPADDLYVSCADNRVRQYDMASGAFVRVLVNATGNLSSPRDIVFLPGARLIIASLGNDRLLEYDGLTGAFVRQFNYGHFGLGLDGAWGLRAGPDGRVYATGSLRTDFHLTDPRMLMYDPHSGWLLRSYVQRPDSRLRRPRGFDFMPGAGLDCNLNQVPDSCDIASGRSLDANQNGVPDECEICVADCNRDGSLNLADFGCFQTKFALGDPYADCNGDGARNLADFGCFQSRFALGCP